MPVSASPRVGLLARCTRSGLGYLSKSFYDHYGPEAVVCVTDADRRYRDNIDWYPGAVFCRWGDMNPFPFERFFSEIDVLFGYETFYHAKVLQTAKRMKVKTVLMAMPELTRSRGMHDFIGDADRNIYPTRWLLPDKAKVVPVPIEHELRGLHAYPYHDGPLRVLHVAGARAIGDRNGTESFIAALGLLRQPVHARICINDNFDPRFTVRDNVTVEVLRGVENRAEMYEGMHLMVLPRRYGGLSLVAQEAAAAGLALVMTDCEPNADYPAQLMHAHPGSRQAVPVGKIETFEVHPTTIAETIDTLAVDPDLLGIAQKAATDWADRHTWTALWDRYLDAFGIYQREGPRNL